MVHIVSILNITRYTAQVNRHHINMIMDKVDKMVHDVNGLYNITTSLHTSLSYHQLVLYLRSVLANLWDSLSYNRVVSMHTIDYVNAATTGTLSPHIFPITDLKQMLSKIEETLPPTMHLPVSSEDTLHFYRYPHTHVLIAYRQLLLLIDVPIQDHTQQLSIYNIFTLNIPHGNFTAGYDISTQYLGVTQDETMAVEISQHQFSFCQEANGQLCNIYEPLQPLANLLSCITALYTKNAATISTRCLLQIRKTQIISTPSQIAPNVWILTSTPPACRATSPHFHLPPHYETSALTVNISLDMANLNMVNISSLDIHIWQHWKDHRNETQLHHLSSIHSVPIAQLYKHMSSGNTHVTPFTSPIEPTADTESTWTLFSHTGVYVTAIGSIILAGLGIFCCYIFWCQPARLVYQPLQPGST